jgi:hypothetical protein
VALLPALVLILLTVALFAAMVPLSIVMRYRQGARRRQGRRWVATLNLVSIGMSLLIFLAIAALSSAWIPNAFPAAATGIGGGLLLGLLGLALTRWERHGPLLHYTPHRLLALAITLLVAARIAYGLWRAWRAWRVTPEDDSWLAAAGIAGSLAAGGVLLGYSLMYWAGLRIRLASQPR